MNDETFHSEIARIITSYIERERANRAPAQPFACPISVKDGRPRTVAPRLTKLRRVLVSLTTRDRAILLMDLAGWNHHAIAASLGAHPGTTRARLDELRADVEAQLGTLVEEP